MKRTLESLDIWIDARSFVNAIYQMMNCNSDYGFRDQIQRAAVSIMNNIAEGSESGSDAKYVNFLQISRGSCSEVRSMLYLCLDRKMINQESFDHLKEDAISISNQIYRLIESLNKSQKRP
jgi:four helix bundle protein